MVSEYLKEFGKVYSDTLNKVDKYNERMNTSNSTYNVNAFNMGKVRLEEQDKNESKAKYDLVNRGVDLNRSLIANALDPKGGEYREKLFTDINANLKAREMNPMTRWEFDNILVKIKEVEDAKKKTDVVSPVGDTNDEIKLTYGSGTGSQSKTNVVDKQNQSNNKVDTQSTIPEDSITNRLNAFLKLRDRLKSTINNGDISYNIKQVSNLNRVIRNLEYQKIDEDAENMDLANMSSDELLNIGGNWGKQIVDSRNALANNKLLYRSGRITEERYLANERELQNRMNNAYRGIRNNKRNTILNRLGYMLNLRGRF